MTWRDRQQFFPENEAGNLAVVGDNTYRRARFKDAEFWVSAYNLEPGRRQSIQKIPGDRYTIVQDLGVDSSEIRVNAYLIGDDYDRRRADLELRLNEGGAGELRLPWRDPMTVTIVGKFSVDETTAERGYCTVTFSCVETSVPPTVFTQDTAARVRSSASDARAQTQERFLDRYSIQTLPETNRGKFRASLNSAAKKITGAQNRISAFIAEIPKDANTINRLAGSLNQLINTPLNLSDEIVNSVITAYSALRSTGATTENVIKTWGRGGPIRILADQTFRFSDGFTATPVAGFSETANIERRNLESFHSLVALNMFYEFAELVTLLPFESRAQAISLRSDYIDAIDPWVLQAQGLEYDSLAALNEAVGSYLEEVARTLPELATVTPVQVTPALVMSHTVYGDATRELEIVVRNNIQHPGFLTADTPLEVVVD